MVRDLMRGLFKMAAWLLLIYVATVAALAMADPGDPTGSLGNAPPERPGAVWCGLTRIVDPDAPGNEVWYCEVRGDTGDPTRPQGLEPGTEVWSILTVNERTRT